MEKWCSGMLKIKIKNAKNVNGKCNDTKTGEKGEEERVFTHEEEYGKKKTNFFST